MDRLQMSAYRQRMIFQYLPYWDLDYFRKYRLPLMERQGKWPIPWLRLPSHGYFYRQTF